MIPNPNPGGIPFYSTSADGSTWTTPAAIPNATNGVFFFGASISVNTAGNFVVTGYNSFGTTPWYAFSANGSTWTAQPMTGSGFTPKALAWSNYHNVFVTIGDISGSLGYSTSTNGTTWTNPVSITGSTNLMTIFSLTEDSSGILVGVGQLQTAPGSNSLPCYITSTNATDWCVPTLFNGSTSIGYMRGVVYSASLSKFVAVGTDSGLNWTYSVSI
jgi:hypothetical protein